MSWLLANSEHTKSLAEAIALICAAHQLCRLTMACTDPRHDSLSSSLRLWRAGDAGR
jgi:hypothetical protein